MTLCNVEISRDTYVTEARQPRDSCTAAPYGRAVITLSQCSRTMRRWFYGPFIAYLHKIVAGGDARWAAIVLPMEQAYSATALMCPQATFDKSQLRPALQVFFCLLGYP